MDFRSALKSSGKFFLGVFEKRSKGLSLKIKPCLSDNQPMPREIHQAFSLLPTSVIKKGSVLENVVLCRM